jgi:hypothetical protein
MAYSSCGASKPLRRVPQTRLNLDSAAVKSSGTPQVRDQDRQPEVSEAPGPPGPEE